MKTLAIWLVIVMSTLLWAKETPDLSEETYQFDVSDVGRLDVSISYGLGELNIISNPEKNSIEGLIEYDSDYVVPEVDYFTIGSKGKLEINVESLKHRGNDHHHRSFDFGKNLSRDGYEGRVEFKLPESKPTDLKMDFGLGEANLDLSGLSITDLDMDCGLSDVKISMDTPNPVSCRRLSISSGLGDFNASNLGNLKPHEFELEVGLGSATIDLTGDISNDFNGDIEVGLGSLDLILPNNVNIRLEVEDTFLSSVDVEGLVKKNGVWVSREWDKHLPTVELEVSVGLGSVDVEVESGVRR